MVKPTVTHFRDARPISKRATFRVHSIKRSASGVRVRSLTIINPTGAGGWPSFLFRLLRNALCYCWYAIKCWEISSAAAFSAGIYFFRSAFGEWRARFVDRLMAATVLPLAP